nr:reverse transcriptase domain-containing protein [Tanacetum cinerariifolium]
MSQTERQKEKVAENASNKRKWESNHNGSLSQQNKRHKVPRAPTAWSINKKAYAGSLPLCNQCKSHHSGPCTVKCGNCKKVGHIIQNYGTPSTAKNQRTRTCYECGSMGHYKTLHNVVSLYTYETMTTINQGMSIEEIEQVVAQRVANAIEAIAIYETKTNLARKSMSQTERQEEKVAENASNKRKWEDCGRQILHLNPLQTIIKGVANIIERPVAEFLKFIDPHQYVFLVLVLVDKSSWVRISSICFTAP